jgi:ceramide glucosyltransferase
MVFIEGLGVVIAAGGIAYLLLAHYRLKRFAPAAPWPIVPPPPVSVLVPVHGLGPRLADCLGSVIRLAGSGRQLVFGLHHAEDPARPLIEALIAGHPEADITLIIDERRIGANPKNCNLANMLPAARHDILVMIDDDVLVAPDLLEILLASLAEPGVGAVTCLYQAAPEPGLAARLGALAINDWFIPSVLVDLGRREMDLCYGAVIAIHRSALDAIGGFAAMADAVAQDYVLGHALRRAGLRIRLAPTVVETVVADPSLPALLRHELRWSRAVRAVRPLDHALSVFTFAELPAGLLLLIGGPWRPALSALLLILALRLLLHSRLRQVFALPLPDPWLLPLRSALCFGVWGTAYAGRRVHWGDRVLVTRSGLTMQADNSKDGRAAP